MCFTFIDPWLLSLRCRFKYFSGLTSCISSSSLLWKWQVPFPDTVSDRWMRTSSPALQTCTLFTTVTSWSSLCGCGRQTGIMPHASLSRAILLNPCHWLWCEFVSKVREFGWGIFYYFHPMRMSCRLLRKTTYGMNAPAIKGGLLTTHLSVGESSSTYVKMASLIVYKNNFNPINQ